MPPLNPIKRVEMSVSTRFLHTNGKFTLKSPNGIVSVKVRMSRAKDKQQWDSMFGRAIRSRAWAGQWPSQVCLERPTYAGQICDGY